VVAVDADADAMQQLTDRELQLLTLLCQGLGDKEIARRCGIKLGTVKAHMMSIRLKLGAANRTQAVVIALVSGLVTLELPLADPTKG
jgi:DNA-binding CsgD family transcriptional regulator